MKRNMNLVMGEALKEIKKYKPEDTTVEEAIIIYRSHRMNAKWLSQRFSADILGRIANNHEKHDLNAIQLRNIVNAIEIINESTSAVKKRRTFKRFFGI